MVPDGRIHMSTTMKDKTMHTPESVTELLEQHDVMLAALEDAAADPLFEAMPSATCNAIRAAIAKARGEV